LESAHLSTALALAATAALIGGLIARRLGQSTLAGYVVAGVVLGAIPGGPSEESVGTLAEIGVVLLMFSLGVQFDLRELGEVRRVALPGALVQIPATLVIGLAVAVAAGWAWRAGVVFGAAAAISGGTVLAKLLSDRGEEGSAHGRIAVGWSVAQDMATVGLVVLLAAITGEASPRELGQAVAIAAAFIAGMVVVGTRVFPWLLDRVARENSRELFILAAAVLSVGAALLSESAGLSIALGAFVAGLVVSESDLSTQVLGELLPIRDVFAALFFVAIGLLVRPEGVLDHIPLVALFTVVILAVKSAIAAALTVWLGQSPRTALLVGAGLASSAEFSFILAQLGVDEGLLSESQFGVVVAATSASIVFAPFLFLPIPWMLRMVGGPPTAAVADDEPVAEARYHAVICGHGRVGSLIAETLRRRGFRYVVIEENRRLVAQLRDAGVEAIYGNAAHPHVLRRARVDAARTLVLAIPDPITTRLAVTHARALNRRLDIVVRARSPIEAALLRQMGVAEAVVAEREAALELTRHTLHRLGLSMLETQAIVQAMRAEG
jgi:CPA2 family monovalent cation:H+ antiporter-2